MQSYDRPNISLICIHINWFRSDCKTVEFTQNYSGKCDIINQIKILTKRVTYMINAVIPKEYQKYPSTTILEHANDLAKVNKYTYGCLPSMAPHENYSIKIHVLTVTLADISQ